MGIVFCKNPFIGELFWHLRIYGYNFQKFLRIYGWYCYELNGTTPYLGNSSYPPPQGCLPKLVRYDMKEWELQGHLWKSSFIAPLKF